jgi:antitoxin MazE
MRTSIIQIGNSKGIILPSDVLRKLHLSLKSSVEIEVEDDSIMIKPSPRQGWAKAFEEFAASGSEETFFPDFFEGEDLSWWKWSEGEK